MTIMETKTTLNPESSRLNLPANFLRELAGAIVDAVDVDSIYIFGSYARGEERADSDVDICVVTEKPDDRFCRKYVAASKALHRIFWEKRLDYDLVNIDRTKFDQLAGERALVFKSVHNEGVRIYG